MEPKPSLSTSLLLFFAVKEETSPLKRWLAKEGWQRKGEAPCPAERYERAGQTLYLCLTGMGKTKARQVSEAVLQKLHPTHVLTCGFAGALDPSLQVGDLLCQKESDPVPLFFCADHVITKAKEKSTLWKATGCRAVEMESGIIQKVCAAHSVDCTILRSISDTAAKDLPLDFEALTLPNGKISIGGLAREIMLHPGKIPALIQLGKNSSRAAHSLAQGIEPLIQQKNTSF